MNYQRSIRVAALAVTALTAGCASLTSAPPPDAGQPAAQAPAASVVPALTLEGYKKQAARHIVAASPEAFDGKLPEILKSVVVLDLTIDRDGKGFGSSWKKGVREASGAIISMGAFGEVLPRYDSYVELDPLVKDRWGIPVLRFHYEFGDNEKKMCQDMVATGREIFEEAGIEILEADEKILTKGWSIHELGTARMGSDPRTSVLNAFQQAHDVKNRLVVAGSSHVSASAQNPTWTIMALAWRSCEHVADQMKKGAL